MSRLARRWSGFWFAPRPPIDLAVGRIVLFAGLFVLYRGLDTSAWAQVSPIFWAPEGFFRLLGLRPLPAPVLAVLDLLWKVCLLLAAIGLRTRAAMAGAFVLGFYLLGLPHNFGKIHHDNGLIVLVLGVLALSRAGDALSVDRWLARRRGAAAATASGEHTWPVRLVQTIVAISFFAAGVAKLRVSGWGWVGSDNLANLLVLHHYTQDPPLTDLGLTLAAHPLLARALALASLLLELAAPLAVFSERARRLVVPGLVGMMAGFLLFFGFTPWPYLLACSFFVPWRRLGRRLSRHRPAPLEQEEDALLVQADP